MLLPRLALENKSLSLCPGPFRRAVRDNEQGSSLASLVSLITHPAYSDSDLGSVEVTQRVKKNGRASRVKWKPASPFFFSCLGCCKGYISIPQAEFTFSFRGSREDGFFTSAVPDLCKLSRNPLPWRMSQQRKPAKAKPKTPFENNGSS